MREMRCGFGPQSVSPDDPTQQSNPSPGRGRQIRDGLELIAKGRSGRSSAVSRVSTPWVAIWCLPSPTAPCDKTMNLPQRQFVDDRPGSAEPCQTPCGLTHAEVNLPERVVLDLSWLVDHFGFPLTERGVTRPAWARRLPSRARTRRDRALPARRVSARRTTETRG